MHEGKPFKVKLFCLMKGSDLSTKMLATELDSKWKPTCRLMMKAPGMKLIPEVIGEDFAHRSYVTVTENFKERVSYIWLKAD